MTRSGSDAWTRYWASAAGDRGRGCLPNAGGPVEAAQRIAWQSFARPLPKGARLLDLATGNGIVLAWIAAARRDLRLVGVDSAEALPPPPPGAQLKAGVALERLPFGDHSFDAAASQFGLEYANVPAAAAELARVLRPGAPLRLIVHHRESPIVTHNRGRRAALAWAAGCEGPLAKARALAAAGLATAVPPALRAAPAEAQRLFPGQSAAAELAAGVLQRLELLGRRGPAETLASLGALDEEAAREMARIALMEEAARDEVGAAALRASLLEAGFTMAPLQTLADPGSARPLAWLMDGRR